MDKIVKVAAVIIVVPVAIKVIETVALVGIIATDSVVRKIHQRRQTKNIVIIEEDL